jgi:acetyl-CoA synthase
VKLPELLDIAETGAKLLIEEARVTARQAEESLPAAQQVGFPGTAYGLPLAYAMLGAEEVTVNRLSSLIDDIEALIAGEDRWRDAEPEEVTRLGVGAAVAQELSACLTHALKGESPDGWIGFIPDDLLRALGVQLVDGRIAGFVVLYGVAADAGTTAEMVQQAQQRRMIVALGGARDSDTGLVHLREQGIEPSVDTFVVPIAPDPSAIAFALNFMVRASLIYGRGAKGDLAGNLAYCRERVPACAVALGELSPQAVALAVSAMAFGVPIVTDQEIPTIPELSSGPGPALSHVDDPGSMVQAAAEARGIRVQVAELDVPVLFGPAFEGERIRKEQLHVQFGSKYSEAFEHLYAAEMDDVEDAQVRVIGPDIDSVEPGAAMPLGVVVRVAGRKMQRTYEPVLERHIHAFLNYASGLMHIGQREMCWVRISDAAYERGLRLRHIGVILHAMMHESFPEFVDRVAVDVITDPEHMERPLQRARESYAERDARMAEMSDESVDTFYSCALCQSFAPNHICIVKPERMGLCGAYTWLDARVSHEMDATGPNQPVPKGECLDERHGEWAGVNEFVHDASNKTLDRFQAYSMMQHPETSCGCFECIVAVVPEANGIMVVHREYMDMTPVGMTFSTLAGSVGGGVQTPGFMGVARRYVLSRKFVRGDGGLQRLVWMPTELKDALGEELRQRAEEEGVADLIDRIADETVATDLDGLMEHLRQVDHPALSMPALL